MSPSHTISTHLCKQIYTSWQQSRQSNGQLPVAVDPTLVPSVPYPARRSPSPEKRSMDSDRSDAGVPMSRSSSQGSWTWGSR
ncbi:hypothetical protein PFICI_06694 [Pestalotiopsis fici W106-1]|uniref:Uncharacterized protein n=1 Tax=Pestalotiopsis fici (strain W106-1 / CGMCC3.15140) TaxID=1229662 RepID=W3X8G1_PESFW|nr:uncharacterized protein PFICI_06694 [Pestalotiopsis fici W106-1]ETS81692.1 hypothetical protein PFICI_06694 [Pestalotiopsis fici W106-1]